MIENQSIGISVEFPVLMKDIPETYAYLRALCKIKEGLSFNRIGAIKSIHFPELLDKYEFFIENRHFCYLFTYSYHTESSPIVPSCFKDLNTSIDNEIFEKLDQDSYRGQIADDRIVLESLVRLILIKYDKIKDDHVVWSEVNRLALIELLEKKGFGNNFENVVLNEWFNANSSLETLSPFEFKNSFVQNFHHIKIAKFTPSFVQDRNAKIQNAFNQIRETINRIQAWQDNEKVRVRVELNNLKLLENFSYISQICTPFIFIVLGCDQSGSYHLSFGLDTNYLKILPDDMASTLIRRIYQFTSGEMESFVSIISLGMDCISLFENMIEEAIDNNAYQITKVPRNPYNSVQDMLKEIQFNDDLDDGSKR
jgi:hypothetical protein